MILLLFLKKILVNLGGKVISKSGKQSRNPVNEQITAPRVILIGKDGSNFGEVDLKVALSKASAENLDLVEIQPNFTPPITKIMDHGKFVFELKKKRKKSQTKKKVQKIKEVKLRPVTDVGDYEVKLRSIRSFLEKGNKVKVSVWFKGREMMHQELGVNLLEKIKENISDIGKVEYFPEKIEGRQLTMMVVPQKVS